MPNHVIPAARARVTFGLLAWFLAGTVLAQSTVLEVIPLRYRTAQEVIPVIQPMLPREGSVSGFQGQLVVRTTPANLEEIKRILASLDTAPRQLLVTVRQDADRDRGRSAAEVSGSIGGRDGRVTVPPVSREPRGGTVILRQGDDEARARVVEGRAAESERNTQSIRVLEGREAFVRVGQAVPVRERQLQRAVVGGRVVEQVVESTQYRDVTTGFYVRPRISGDRVTLEISSRRESLSRQTPRGVDVQSMTTSVSGRLGEWLDIGGISQDSSGHQSVLLGRAASAARDDRRVLIRVEEAR